MEYLLASPFRCVVGSKGKKQEKLFIVPKFSSGVQFYFFNAHQARCPTDMQEAVVGCFSLPFDQICCEYMNWCSDKSKECIQCNA